jgi:hypothetical protein
MGKWLKRIGCLALLMVCFLALFPTIIILIRSGGNLVPEPVNDSMRATAEYLYYHPAPTPENIYHIPDNFNSIYEYCFNGELARYFLGISWVINGSRIPSSMHSEAYLGPYTGEGDNYGINRTCLEEPFYNRLLANGFHLFEIQMGNFLGAIEVTYQWGVWVNEDEMPTPYPTFTPYPISTPYPTFTPYPTSTPYPTFTPYPTSTPYPTFTPKINTPTP